MSKNDPALANTVHHKGRVYEAGMTLDEIGEVAREFGAHVWEGGTKPNFPQTSGGGVEGGGETGSRLGTPPTPSPSALPGPDTSAAIAAVTGTEAPARPGVPADGGDADGGGTAKRATGGRGRATS